MAWHHVPACDPRALAGREPRGISWPRPARLGSPARAAHLAVPPCLITAVPLPLPLPASPLPPARSFAAKDPKLAFLDCGSVFLTKNRRAIDSKLMADAIHPTAEGWAKLMQCMNPTITALMK